jgi:hypothetical protein
MPSASPPFQGLATSERVKPLTGRQRLSGKSSNFGSGDPPPNATPPRLATGTAQMDKRSGQVARYHADAIAATVEGRGGKCSERRTMRGDVALAYNAAARDERDRAPRSCCFSKASKTANGAETLLCTQQEAARVLGCAYRTACSGDRSATGFEVLRQKVDSKHNNQDMR